MREQYTTIKKSKNIKMIPIPCFLEDTSHIYCIHSPKQLTGKKQRIQKWDPTANKSDCTALAYVQNPWLREVDLEQNPKRGSDKMIMQLLRKKASPNYVFMYYKLFMYNFTFSFMIGYYCWLCNENACQKCPIFQYCKPIIYLFDSITRQ